jgi:hypothetical protein
MPFEHITGIYELTRTHFHVLLGRDGANSKDLKLFAVWKHAKSFCQLQQFQVT